MRLIDLEEALRLCRIYDLTDTYDMLSSIKTIDKTKHGEWIDRGRKGLFCSVCGSGCLLNYESDYHPSLYCPHCGARMGE